MSLDLNEVKAAQARVYAEVSVYEKGDAALGFLDSGVVDDLVAEVERLREALDATSGRLREARVAEEISDGNLDLADAEVERLRAEVDTCTGCGSSLLACLRWVNDLDPAHLKCCPDCHHPQEHLVWLDLRESCDEARAQVARVEALCDEEEAKAEAFIERHAFRYYGTTEPGSIHPESVGYLDALSKVRAALRGPETSGAVSTAVTGDAATDEGAGVAAPAPEPRDRWGRCPNCGVEHTGDDCMEGKFMQMTHPWHAKQVIGCILAFTPWRLP